MRAAVLKEPYVLQLEDVPRFPIEPGWVTVAVECCGICGSDIRYYVGENPWALHTRGEAMANPPNIILGHEFCGRVVEVGCEDDERLLGQRVGVVPYESCGVCAVCRRGWHHLCPNTVHLGHGAGWGEQEYYPGGMADFCPVWAKRCYPLPEGIASSHAALLDVVGVAVHAVALAEMRPQSEVAVIGAGPIGLSIAQVARVWGARRIFAIDIYDLPLEIAAKLDIGQCYRADRNDIVGEIKELTEGSGVDVIWDTAGTPETFATAVALLAPRGRVINLAIHKTECRLDPTALGAERYVRSSANYRYEEFPVAIDLMATGAVDMEPIITNRIPLDRVSTFMPGLVDKQASGESKVVVEVGKGRNEP